MKDLITPIAVRVHTVAPGSRQRHDRRPVQWRDAPVGHRLLAIVMEGEEDGARPFGLGMFRVRARQADVTYGPADRVTLIELLNGIVMGDALSPRDRAVARAWARWRGLRAISVQEYVHEVFFEECYVEGALGVAWEWGVLAALTIWVGTGNNVRVGADLRRRCYWIRLDAEVARPWERSGFRHPNLRQWTRERRGQLVDALPRVRGGRGVLVCMVRDNCNVLATILCENGPAPLASVHIASLPAFRGIEKRGPSDQ
jgi:hypothetical protein